MTQSIKTLALRFHPKRDFYILDQTLLPEKKVFIKIESPLQMSRAIRQMKVRGANLIGITAGFSLAQYAFKEFQQEKKQKRLKPQKLKAQSSQKQKDFKLNKSQRVKIKVMAERLKEARPTAIHLSQAVDRALREKTALGMLQQALQIYKEDEKACEAMALQAQSLIKKGDQILTYCNTGSLATGGIGTALGVIKKAHQEKKNIHVFVCETRPYDQGSRLTFWELQQEKVPCTLICDNMLGALISEKKIHKAFVGADRISKNGDTANKIGTYNMALICKSFQVPFFVVAPEQTIDEKLKKGSLIPIEQRDPKEVSAYWAKKGAGIWNPSFDITPRKLITGIITEKGLL